MKYKDKLNLIRKHIINKYSIIFCIFMIFMMTIFATASIVYYLYTITVNDMFHNSLDARRLDVDNYTEKVDMEKIKNISHVEAVDNYIIGYYPLKSHISKEQAITILLEPIVTSKDIITTNNKVLNPDETGYIVCPKKLNHDLSYKIEYSSLLNMKDYIGQTIIADNLNLTLIDTYDSDKYYEEKSICFISLHDFKILQKDPSYLRDTVTYVQVDSVKNMEYVTKELKNLGYRVSPIMEFDYETISTMRKLSLTTIFITLISSTLFIALIISKKNKYEKKLNQLFFDIGMKEKEIKKYRNLELLILLIISIFISCLFSFLSYLSFKHIIYNEFLNEGNLVFPFNYFLLFIVIVAIFIFIINTYRIEKELA